MHGSLALIELGFLTAWLLVRQGIKIPFLATLGTLFSGMEHLLAAHWHSLRGRSLHMWEQHSDTRTALAESDLS